MDDSSKPVASAITTPLVIVSAIFPALSALSIFLRFYARRKSRQSYHADDAWVVVAWVSFVNWSFLDDVEFIRPIDLANCALPRSPPSCLAFLFGPSPRCRVSTIIVSM